MVAVVARLERSAKVPGTPQNHGELVAEIRECEQQLGILDRLTTFESLTHLVLDFPSFRDRWVVVELDLKANRVRGAAFRESEKEVAAEMYAEREFAHRGDPNYAIVMVSAKSVQSLRRAYPNYFGDLSEFRSLVRETVA